MPVSTNCKMLKQCCEKPLSCRNKRVVFNWYIFGEVFGANFGNISALHPQAPEFTARFCRNIPVSFFSTNADLFFHPWQDWLENQLLVGTLTYDGLVSRPGCTSQRLIFWNKTTETCMTHWAIRFFRRQCGSVVRVEDLNAEDPGSNPRFGLLELICPRWSQGQIHHAL